MIESVLCYGNAVGDKPGPISDGVYILGWKENTKIKSLSEF